MTNPSPLSIGALARKAGCSVPAIRYYEQIGLLPAVARTEGGRRIYASSMLNRLTFIRRCREFGFSIEQIRELVGLVDAPERPCAEVREIAARHLTQLRNKLAELQALEHSLSVFVHGCDSACADGAAMNCSIFEDLAAPKQALAVRGAQPKCCAQ